MGVTDERTQMAKIRYLQVKDDTQRLICRTLHEHNGNGNAEIEGRWK